MHEELVEHYKNDFFLDNYNNKGNVWVDRMWDECRACDVKVVVKYNKKGKPLLYRVNN